MIRLFAAACGGRVRLEGSSRGSWGRVGWLAGRQLHCVLLWQLQKQGWLSGRGVSVRASRGICWVGIEGI